MPQGCVHTCRAPALCLTAHHPCILGNHLHLEAKHWEESVPLVLATFLPWELTLDGVQSRHLKIHHSPVTT